MILEFYANRHPLFDVVGEGLLSPHGIEKIVFFGEEVNLIVGFSQQVDALIGENVQPIPKI